MKKGFTLLEMAIVLTIIGLIIGSILAGRSMIRSAELRDAIGEYDMYGKAIKEFQDKYQALPGDMNNATDIWGTTVTANGDGSGTIGSSTTAGVLTNTAGSGGISNAGEWYLTWQHLALAGFIPGNFTGTSTDGKTAVIGSNVPASKLPGAGWTIVFYVNDTNNTTSMWPDPGQYGQTLNFGGFSSGSYTTGAILTPAEAQSLDQKLDDGMPGTGKIRAWRTNANCITSAATPSQTSDTYSTVYNGQACSLVFLLGF